MLPPHHIATVLAALLLSTPAWAVYKCKNANGSITYQATPCANGSGDTIDTRPAASYGHAPAVTAPAAAAESGATPEQNAPATPTSGYQAKEGPFNEKWRRMNYLRNRGVPDANWNLNSHNNDCRIKMQQLENKKRHANNNLAGATWEQSISAEMQAHATMCDMRGRELQSHRDRLEQELRELQAQNP